MDELRKQVIRGKVLDIPPYPLDVVKIYICTSTQDMMTERAHILKHAFPRLRQYCKEKYAIEFQLVDMKWGVGEPEIDTFTCLRHCLDTIAECKRQSIGPNFVLMLGQKYGTIILQRYITVIEMDTLCQYMEDEQAKIVKTYYKLDDNARPPVYIKELGMETAGENMLKMRNQLLKIFKESAKKAVDAGTLEYKVAMRFFTSAVEQEITEGLLNNPESDAECIVFTRHFPSINLQHKSAHRYVDLYHGKADKEAQKQLIQLLEQKILPKVPSSNLFQYTDLKWGNATHGGVSELTHGEYLEDFAADFFSALQDMIDKSMTKRVPLPRDDIFLECLAQAEIVRERCSTFNGREKELKSIRRYIDDSRSGSALMLCGPSACGKTTIIAKAAALVNSGWNQRDVLQIVLFLGTSPATLDIIELLKHLIKHISVLLAEVNQTEVKTPELVDDFDSLSFEFNHILGQVPKANKLIIFLDAIDELENSKEAFTKMWIPTRLPTNVKVIVSLLEEGNTPLQLLSFGNILEISNLEPAAVQEFLQSALESEKRSLTKLQWNHLRKTFGNKPQRALYVRLIWDIVRTWHSYITDLPKLPSDMNTYIKKLFEHLEAEHGRSLVTHAVTFLEMTKYGIGDNELEDLFSLDEEVMEEVFEHFIPPMRRFPAYTWRKFMHDLKYLAPRYADGTRVFTWYHKVFRKVVQSRYNPCYTPSDEFKSQTGDMVVTILTEYFTGKWGDIPKSFQYTKKQLRRTGLLNPFAESVRCVPKHPTMLVTLEKDGSLKTGFNHRKISVLLDAYLTLIRSNMDAAIDLLTEFTQNVIFDYEMIYALLKSERVRLLVQIQELCAIAIPAQCAQELMRRELFLFSECIIQDVEYLRQNPQCCGPFLQSQNLNFYGLLPYLTRFIDTVDTIGRDMCALVPTSQQMVSCVSRAQCRVIDHSGTVYGCVCTEMCIYSLSKRLVAARYELSGYTTVYSKLLHPPPGDYFSKIIAAEGPWDAGFEIESDNMEWVIIYLVLTYRPHIYVMQGSTGQQLRIIKCEEICKEIKYSQKADADVESNAKYGISAVYAIGSQNNAWHLLCVSFNCGYVLVIHSQSITVVWKQTENRQVVSHLDNGYFRGTHVYGFGQDSGTIHWLCWNNFQTDPSSQFSKGIEPAITEIPLPKHADEKFSHIELIVEDDNDRSMFMASDDGKSHTTEGFETFKERLHTVFATSNHMIHILSDIVEIDYGEIENNITVHKSHPVEKTISISLPVHEPVKCLTGKVALTAGDVKNLIVACSTTRNAYLIAFDRINHSALVTHSFESTFDHLLLRNGLLVGTFCSRIELYNVVEHQAVESIVVQRLVELDEQRGRVRHVCASSHSGVMLVTCSEYNTMAVYLTHLLNVHSGDSYSGALGSDRKRCAQDYIASMIATSNLVATLSKDQHDIVIWDVQNDTIKREIHVKEAVEQFCLSITETHVVIATVSGRVLLYTVEDDEDIPTNYIKQFHIQHVTSCWMTSLHSQPQVVCIINKQGGVVVINVHTCHINNMPNTRLPQAIDSVVTRNHDIYVIAHKWRSFIGIQPSDNTVTWELDMNNASGKSLQKFGRRIINLCEYNGDVYLILTGNPQNITSTNDVFTLLCIKPTSNSIFKILDLTLPKTTEITCALGESNYILLYHSDQVQVVDLSQGTVVLTEKLQYAAITTDGQYVAGILEGRILKLFRMLDKRCIATYTLRVNVVALCISTEDEYITVAGDDRQIYSFALADPYKQEHSMTIKKLPSRNRAIASEMQYAKEDSRFDLLHQITKILDSSGYVSEAVSSLDSAYGHASRIYSFDGESRTTKQRIRGEDLLNQVFGGANQTQYTRTNEDGGATSRTPSTLKNQNQEQIPTPSSPTPSADTAMQSLCSVEIPVALSSSALTDSPTKPMTYSASLADEGEGLDMVGNVEAKELKLDLSELENASMLNTGRDDLNVGHQNGGGGGITESLLSAHVRQGRDPEATKSGKSVRTHKSGEVVQSVVVTTKTQAPLKPQRTADTSITHASSHMTNTTATKFEEITPSKPFVLSYKSAVLQKSTQERLQRIKNQFVEVGLEEDASSLNTSNNTDRMNKSTNRSGRSHHMGELVASYNRKRSRSRSKSPKSTTRLPEGNKTSRACIIS